jgi:hypothetical protein
MAILLASSVRQSVRCVVAVAEVFAAHGLNTVLSAQNEILCFYLLWLGLRR